jgi:hypothetical protein
VRVGGRGRCVNRQEGSWVTESGVGRVPEAAQQMQGQAGAAGPVHKTPGAR